MVGLIGVGADVATVVRVWPGAVCGSAIPESQSTSVQNESADGQALCITLRVRGCPLSTPLAKNQALAAFQATRRSLAAGVPLAAGLVEMRSNFTFDVARGEAEFVPRLQHARLPIQAVRRSLLHGDHEVSSLRRHRVLFVPF